MRVAHLTVDGNKAGNSKCNRTDGLVIQAWLATVEDVHITNAAANGLLIAAQPAMHSSQVCCSPQPNKRALVFALA